MSRDICIYLEFLTDAHRRQIEAAAEETGFTPHFFTLDQFEEARACLQRCEVLYAHSVDLLRAAPASLKWYCCSFAGVDLYCKDPSLFANPDCLLTNSNVYGVTIAEHVVMVTLMLLRRMPEYDGDRPEPQLVQPAAHPLHPGQRVHHPGHRRHRPERRRAAAGHGGREDRGPQPQRPAPPGL